MCRVATSRGSVMAVRFITWFLAISSPPYRSSRVGACRGTPPVSPSASSPEAMRPSIPIRSGIGGLEGVDQGGNAQKQAEGDGG